MHIYCNNCANIIFKSSFLLLPFLLPQYYTSAIILTLVFVLCDICSWCSFFDFTEIDAFAGEEVGCLH